MRGVLLRDDDPKVRIQAAWAIDKLGDDAVKEVVEYLVGALRGDAEVAKAVAAVLASRKTRVLTGLPRSHYLLPVYPLLALLTAERLARAPADDRARAFRVAALIASKLLLEASKHSEPEE